MPATSGFGRLLLAVMAASCSTPPPPPRAEPAAAVHSERPPAHAERPRFDGHRAHEDLRRQVEFGPRVPGTEPHRRAAEWLADSLRPLAQEVVVDRFVAAGQPMMNIIARFRPEAGERLLLCAHWDSRPAADHDPDPARRTLPVPGANDGASGVAVLLELARMFAAQPPDVGVDIALFDGEDWGDFRTGWNDVLLGSQRFAATWTGRRPRYGILLDMIGDADLRFRREEYSQQCCPEVVARIWAVAAALGYSDAFLPGRGMFIEDDHVPLIRAGMKVVDLIDLEYPPWHTTADTVDKTSSRSLQVVGDVVAEVVYREGR